MHSRKVCIIRITGLRMKLSKQNCSNAVGGFVRTKSQVNVTEGLNVLDLFSIIAVYKQD